MKKNLYIYILILLIVMLPFGASASFGGALRANWQNINAELDSAGTQIATTILSLNIEEPIERIGGRQENQNPGSVDVGQVQSGAGEQMPPGGSEGGASGGTTEPQLITPTFCNVEILLPEANQIVPSSFTTAGLVGQSYQGVCAWTVFEANAGEVRVFDADGNPVSQREQLESVGDWMQLPSSFEASIILTAIPHTQTGYIRYTEHLVQDGVVADTFDLPIRFEVWQEARQPGTQTFFGRLFTTITNFFTGKPLPPKPSPADPVKQTPPTQNNPEVSDLGDTVTEIEVAVERSNFSGQLYCEIKLPDDSKFCSGNRVDTDTCRCDTFYLDDGIQKGRTDSALDEAQFSMIDDALFVPLSEIKLTKTLYFGDRGEEVRMLESALSYFGYYNNPPLGLFNNDLRLAVQSFAEKQGESVSGFIISKQIRDMINQAVTILSGYNN